MKPPGEEGIQGGGERCPGCQTSLPAGRARCPRCGTPLTYPAWKKAGAWILLILICYGLVRCHLLLLEGLPEF